MSDRCWPQVQRGGVARLRNDKCNARRRCKAMLFAMEFSSHHTIEEMSNYDFKARKMTGLAVTMRLRGGKLGKLIFCPWCGEKLTVLPFAKQQMVVK